MNNKLRSFKKFFCIVITIIMILPCFSVTASAASKLTASQDCIDLIKQTEGFSKYKYWDYSQWTIGYGTACGADEYPDGITEAEAEKLLKKYVANFSNYVNNFASKNNITLKQNQFDALVSMCYALGSLFDAYGDFDLKTILLNGSDKYGFLEIAKAFGEWRKAGGEVLPGLVKRRHLETALFLKDRTDNTCEVWRVSDSSGINLRKSASSSSTKTGFMVNHTIFSVTEKVKGSDGYTWGKTLYEGKTQWCALDYCTYMVGGPIKGSSVTPPVTTAPSGNKSQKWKITSDDGVKLRSGAGTSYSQVGYIPYKAEITVTETKSAGGYTWGKTSYGGVSGWCVLNYAEKISTPVTTKTTTTVTTAATAASLKSIYISQKPDKTTYNEGDPLDLKGMVVKSVYSDGSEKIIVDYDVSGFESKEGTYDIKVSYKNKTSSFRVTVSGKKLTGIEIASEPNKKLYKTGEGLQINGLTVNGIYNNNTKEELQKFYLDGIEGFSKTVGKKKITVLVNDFTAEFEVEVTEKSLTGITITNLPEITEYVQGQQFDKSGLMVHAVFDNGTKTLIDNYELSEFDPQLLGVQTINVSYNGFTESFDVNVSERDIFELPGDLDGDGERSVTDLIMLNDYLENGESNSKIEKERFYLMDVNLDGKVNADDAEALSKIISEQ